MAIWNIKLPKLKTKNSNGEVNLTKQNLPGGFCERMKNLLGKSYREFEHQLISGKPVQSFYENTYFDSASLPESFFQSVGASKIPYADNGYYFTAEKIGNTAFHHAGALYVQDPSAMCTVCSAQIKSGMKILDMCASPGGKTIYAAIKAGKNGAVVSNEFNVSRCKTLVGNVERMGLSNVIVLNCDAADSNDLPASYPEFFDLIFADTPCSGEGMFRKYPDEAISNWSTENIAMCAVRQKKILDNAAKCLKPGGTIVYSTCTFSLQENEMLIDAFLSEHDTFSLCEAPSAVKNATADAHLFENCKRTDIIKARRFYPHISPGEGQFIAILKKDSEVSVCENKGGKEQFEVFRSSKHDKRLSKGQKNSRNDQSTPSKEEISAIDSFCNGLIENFDISRIKKYGENLIYTNTLIPLPQKHVFSGGIKLGEVVKGRLIPHHQLFKAFGSCFSRKINLDYTDENVYRYLKGETFEQDVPDGWCAVMVNGFVLGGAKAVSGNIKNHYPKGLRIN